MSYVTFEQALEVQVGGHFYRFNVGSYNIEDDLAGVIVGVYGDRGAQYGVLPSAGGPEPEAMELVEAVEEEITVTVEETAEAEAPTPEPSARRKRTS